MDWLTWVDLNQFKIKLFKDFFKNKIIYIF